MLNFLTSNGIRDMAGLDEKVTAMYEKQFAIRDRLKPVERRLKVLDEHIRQAGYYLEFKNIYKKYKQIKPKYQDDFREAHRREITLYEAADRYLKGVMNGKAGLPVKAWKAERAKLTADKQRLNQEYAALKDEVREVEQIRKSVYEIVHSEQRETQRGRSQGIEL